LISIARFARNKKGFSILGFAQNRKTPPLLRAKRAIEVVFIYFKFYEKMDLTFKCVHFSELTIYELYSIMALRQEVFVVEQNCAYLDADGKDLSGFHVLGYADLAKKGVYTEGSPSEDFEGLLAYTRLLPKGIAYADYASIGRVINSPKVRRRGVGKVLMEESIRQMARLFPEDAVKIGAQSYLLDFYGYLGFVSTGEEYMEDGIPHTSMILKK
jgi:ElaA protein